MSLFTESELLTIKVHLRHAVTYFPCGHVPGVLPTEHCSSRGRAGQRCPWPGVSHPYFSTWPIRCGTRALWPLADTAWFLFLVSNPLRRFSGTLSAYTHLETPKFFSSEMNRCKMGCWYEHLKSTSYHSWLLLQFFLIFKVFASQPTHFVSKFLNDFLARICF